MIFHQHKAVFFHIPKTAGYSIERFLDSEKNRNAMIFHPDVVFGLNDGQFTQHLPYSDILKYVSEDVLNEYYKFTFVRNTWDRLVSAFSYIHGQNGTKENFKNELIKKCKLLKSGKMSSTDHYNSQMPYIFFEDKIAVDFIGRFENLQDDFKTVCDALDVPFKELGKKNFSKREDDYRLYYDDDLRNLVYETYSNEINYFNFKF